MRTILQSRALILLSSLQILGAFSILFTFLLPIYLLGWVYILVQFFIDYKSLPNINEVTINIYHNLYAELEKEFEIKIEVIIDKNYLEQVKNENIEKINNKIFRYLEGGINEIIESNDKINVLYYQKVIPLRVVKYKIDKITFNLDSKYCYFKRKIYCDLKCNEINIEPSKKRIPEKLFQMLVLNQKALLHGEHLIKKSRAAEQFHSLRPYRYPDSIRNIDYKKSAKFSSLMTKTFESIHSHHLILCLDIGRVMFGKVNDSRKIDYYISACNNLAEYAISNGDSVSFVAFSQKTHICIRNSKNIVEIKKAINNSSSIGPLEEDSDYSQITKAIPLYKMNRSIVVLMSDVSHSYVRSSIEQIMVGLTRKHSTVTLSLIEKYFELNSKVLNYNKKYINEETASDFIYSYWLSEQINLFTRKLTLFGSSSVVIPDEYWMSSCEKVYSSLRI
jgi:hypothetical protein